MEDEVRKNIPTPNCLLLKNPSIYDSRDQKKIKEYEEQVEKLKLLREKYKKILKTEIHTLNCEFISIVYYLDKKKHNNYFIEKLVSGKIENDIHNFDVNLKNLSLKKINVKSAVLQEFMIRIREQKKIFHKKFLDKKITHAINIDLPKIENKLKRLMCELSVVETEQSELRSKFENFSKRDKIIEEKIRGEFSDLAQPFIDLLVKQFKKRPKTVIDQYTSLTFLQELNKCLVAGKKSCILPQTYLNFLSEMDALDIMPNSLPSQINSNYWQSLSKIRRNKIDSEIKVKIIVNNKVTYF